MIERVAILRFSSSMHNSGMQLDIHIKFGKDLLRNDDKQAYCINNYGNFVEVFHYLQKRPGALLGKNYNLDVTW